MNNQEINFNNLMKRANAFMDRYVNENNTNENLKDLYKRVNGFVEGMTMDSSCNHDCKNSCSNENCNNSCKNENNIPKPVTAIDYANKFFEENNIDFRFELHKNTPMIINGKVYSDCHINECRKIENDDVRITVVATVANWHSETFVLHLSSLRLFYNKIIKADSHMMAKSFNYSWIPLEILTNPLKVVDRTKNSDSNIERPKTIVKKKHPHASYRMHSNAKKETPSNEGEINSNNIQKEPLPKTRETHVNMSDLTNTSARYPWGEKKSTLFDENYKNFERNVSHAFSNKYGKNVSNNEDEINKINMRILKDRIEGCDSLIYINHRDNATPKATRISLFAKVDNSCYNKEYEDFFKAVYSSLKLPEDIKRIIIKLLNSHFKVFGNANEFYFDLPQANKLFKVEFKDDDVLGTLFEVLNEVYDSKIGNFYKFYKIDLKNKEIILVHNKIKELKITIGINDLEREAVRFTEVKENK